MRADAKRRRMVAELALEIRHYCAAHADADNAKTYARYFKEGSYDAWGLLGDRHPLWIEQEPAWLERFAALGVSGFLLLGEYLFSSGKYEEGALAIRFLAKHLDVFEAAHLNKLVRWFAAGLGNWAHSDVLCKLVLEPLLVRETISLDDLAEWRESPKPFQRRAVPVAMLGLLKQANGMDAARFVGYLRPLMCDPERVVQQGMGWFLRETWKRHPLVVEALLLEWKETAPRTIYQYATEKMTPEQKALYRRSKPGK